MPILAVDSTSPSPLELAKLPPAAERLRLEASSSLWGPLTLLDENTRCYSASVRDEINRSLISAWEAGKALPWIFVKVRAAFAQAPSGYARSAGLGSRSIIERLERCSFSDPDRPFDSIYHGMLKYWELSAHERPELATLLTKARQEVLRTLVPHDELTSINVVRKWRVEVGPECFAQAIGTNADEKLRKQSCNSYVTPERIVTIGRSLGLISSTPHADQWKPESPLAEALEGVLNTAALNGRPGGVQALTFLLSALSYSTRKPDLQSLFNLSTIESSRLVRGHCIPWAKVGSVLQSFVLDGRVAAAVVERINTTWVEGTPAAASFSAAIQRLSEERGWDDAFLARTLGIASANRMNARIERLNGFSSGTPGEIALLLARSPEQFEKLCGLALQALREELQQSGSVFRDSPAYQERALWGLSRDDITGIEAATIKKLELGGGESRSREEIVFAIRDTARAHKMRPLLERYLDHALNADVFATLRFCRESASCSHITEEISRYLYGEPRITLVRYRAITEMASLPFSPFHELLWHHYFSQTSADRLHLRRAIATLTAQHRERLYGAPVALPSSSALNRSLYSARPITLSSKEFCALLQTFNVAPQSITAFYLAELNQGSTPISALRSALKSGIALLGKSSLPSTMELQKYRGSKISSLLKSSTRSEAQTIETLLTTKFAVDCAKVPPFGLSYAQNELRTLWQMAPGARLYEIEEALAPSCSETVFGMPLKLAWPPTLSLKRHSVHNESFTVAEVRPFENFVMRLGAIDPGAELLGKTIGRIALASNQSAVRLLFTNTQKRAELNADEAQCVLRFINGIVIERLHISENAKREMREQISSLIAIAKNREYPFYASISSYANNSVFARLNQIIALLLPAPVEDMPAC